MYSGCSCGGKGLGALGAALGYWSKFSPGDAFQAYGKTYPISTSTPIIAGVYYTRARTGDLYWLQLAPGAGPLAEFSAQSTALGLPGDAGNGWFQTVSAALAAPLTPAQLAYKAPAAPVTLPAAQAPATAAVQSMNPLPLPATVAQQPTVAVQAQTVAPQVINATPATVTDSTVATAAPAPDVIATSAPTVPAAAASAAPDWLPWAGLAVGVLALLAAGRRRPSP